MKRRKKREEIVLLAKHLEDKPLVASLCQTQLHVKLWLTQGR